MWEGQRKSKATCNMFIFSFLPLISDAVTTSSILWHFPRQPSAPSDTPSSSATQDTWAASQPGSPSTSQSQGGEAGPTMCSTSRAVYLLIASLTIVHNNQLRHCQRNTHSWHHARREVRAGCSSSSSLLIHRRQEFVCNPYSSQWVPKFHTPQFR